MTKKSRFFERQRKRDEAAQTQTAKPSAQAAEPPSFDEEIAALYDEEVDDVLDAEPDAPQPETEYLDVETQQIDVPMVVRAPAGYCKRHIDLSFNRAEAEKLARLAAALEQQGAKVYVRNGYEKPVVNAQLAVRWLVEQLV